MSDGGRLVDMPEVKFIIVPSAQSVSGNLPILSLRNRTVTSEGSPGYGQIVQMQDIEEICRRIEASQENLVSYISREQAERSEIAAPMPPVSADQPRMVSVTVVVRQTTKILAAVFVMSLATWAYADIPIVNPFVSVIGLAACPFFVWMARAMERHEASS